MLLAVSPPALHAAQDLNNDGWPDLVFTNLYTGGSYITNSYVYWGAATNPYPTNTRVLLPTEGATGVATVDLNKDGMLDIVIANNRRYNTTFNINSYIYWGDPAHTFTSTAPTLLPTTGAYGVSTVDLDGSGCLDVVFSNNRAGTYQTNSYIYYGSTSGATWTPSSLAQLPTYSAFGNFVADFDNNGFLDILFTQTMTANSYLYWGSSAGFSSGNGLKIPGVSPGPPAVADIDNNGYLDIVFANGTDTSPYSVNSYIYWGNATATYTTKNELPSFDAACAKIADLNSDGHLDIVIANNQDGSTCSINSYIYWGDSDNTYSSRSELPTDGAMDIAVGDLNKDGYLDIVFANLKTDASYYANSFIYWGSAGGYSAANHSLLPTVGGHSVSIAGSNIWGCDNGKAMNYPLWATENGYSWNLLSSWEYEFVALKNELLNEGALDLSDEEIAQLISLYEDGNAGGHPSPINIDGMSWSYYGDLLSTGTVNAGNYNFLIAGLDGPTAWYGAEDGTYNFLLKAEGSGGFSQGGEVPEPSTLVLLLPLAILGIWRLRMNDKVNGADNRR